MRGKDHKLSSEQSVDRLAKSLIQDYLAKLKGSENYPDPEELVAKYTGEDKTSFRKALYLSVYHTRRESKGLIKEEYMKNIEDWARNTLCGEIEASPRDSFDLLVEYEERILAGEQPDPFHYFIRCPDSDRPNFFLSLNIATLFLTGKKYSSNEHK